MTTKVTGLCSSCSYPISAQEGELIACPYCGSLNEAVESIAQGITLPGWLVGGVIGLVVGIAFGPPILAGTETGSRYLEEKIRARRR